MKKKIKIFILLIGILFVSTACEGYEEKKDVIPTDVTIYKLNRDVCDKFLNEPSYEILKGNNISEFSLQKNVEWYVTYNNSRFPINVSLIEFLENKEEINQYLLENNFKREIESVAVFDAPNMPLTVWVKTSKDNIYITINEDLEDSLYVYRVYNQDDFRHKYACKTGCLIVNGTEVKTEKPPKIYYNYADIPLLALLESFGAKIETQDKEKIKINFENKIYYLDRNSKKLYEQENANQNLLNSIEGGVTFIYFEDDELMIDSANAHAMLTKMGKSIDFKINWENKIVEINSLEN